MKKWLKFFAVTVASAAASAVLGSLQTDPTELLDYKKVASRAAAGAVVAALTLIVRNPLVETKNDDAAELRKSANELDSQARLENLK